MVSAQLGVGVGVSAVKLAAGWQAARPGSPGARVWMGRSTEPERNEGAPKDVVLGGELSL
jgi:hypothetical protein